MDKPITLKKIFSLNNLVYFLTPRYHITTGIRNKDKIPPTSDNVRKLEPATIIPDMAPPAHTKKNRTGVNIYSVRVVFIYISFSCRNVVDAAHEFHRSGLVALLSRNHMFQGRNDIVFQFDPFHRSFPGFPVHQDLG